MTVDVPLERTRSATLRVLVVHNRYRSEQPSGEDRVVDQESAELTAAGHEVSQFLRHSDDIARMSLRAKAAVPFKVPWNPSVRAELAEHLRADRPDVVHVHCTFPLLSPSVLAACADARVPVVSTLHNYMQVCAPGSLFRNGQICTDCVGRSPLNGVRHGCYRGSSLATLPVAIGLSANRRRWWTQVSRFLCVSSSQRDTLVQAGMPGERMAVQHNIVPDPGVRRSGAGRHVLYLGRLSAEKGVLVLMAAWERLSARGGVRLPLVIAGSGPLQDRVGAWAAAREDVRFLGLQTRDESVALMAEASVVVVPSVWLEPFGLVVVEAMAVGVPVLAAAHGPFAELVDNGTTGLMHRPGDAVALADRIAELTRDPVRNVTMGEAAREHYDRNFQPSVAVARLAANYRTAISLRGYPSP